MLKSSILQANSFHFLHLFGLEMSVAADGYFSHECWSEAGEGLLVHFARADVKEVAYSYAFATAASSQRNTYEAEESWGEIVRDGMIVYDVEIAWTENRVGALNVVCQRVVRVVAVAEYALRRHSIVMYGR